MKDLIETYPSDQGEFPVELSIVIIVKNRAKTIVDAITSALAQEIGQTFNILVIDNHSNDETSKLIEELSTKHPEVLHLTPQSIDLHTSECWNYALNHKACGRYCVQLNPDDIFNSPESLLKIHDLFLIEQPACILSSYTLVNFEGTVISTESIKNKESTNITNAPITFATQLLRENRILDEKIGVISELVQEVSYGYTISHTKDSLYYCRVFESEK